MCVGTKSENVCVLCLYVGLSQDRGAGRVSCYVKSLDTGHVVCSMQVLKNWRRATRFGEYVIHLKIPTCKGNSCHLMGRDLAHGFQIHCGSPRARQ